MTVAPAMVSWACSITPPAPSDTMSRSMPSASSSQPTAAWASS